jgi:hypothetical protein
MSGRIRLRARDVLEVDVAGRTAWLAGELMHDESGGPAFWLLKSADWEWADQSPMTAGERARLVDEVPKLGQDEGWKIVLDEGPWPRDIHQR